ncbi:MAG: 30S ribosomal protein S5 [Candidatus Micrarchaeia archaeon]
MVEEEKFNIDEWNPKTEIGRKVKNKEITSIEQIFEMGKPIVEEEIVDALLPNIKEEVLDISMTQRMSDNGRKTQFRAIVVVGDGQGHIGVGSGKAEEAKPAIETAVRAAKRNVITVPLGCGSWECGCKQKHTIPIKVVGKNGGVIVTLKPAPRGVGIAAHEVVRKVLSMAGVKDSWGFARGRTRSVYNTAMATYDALDSLNRMKFHQEWDVLLGGEKDEKNSGS